MLIDRALSSTDSSIELRLHSRAAARRLPGFAARSRRICTALAVILRTAAQHADSWPGAWSNSVGYDARRVGLLRERADDVTELILSSNVVADEGSGALANKVESWG